MNHCRFQGLTYANLRRWSWASATILLTLLVMTRLLRFLQVSRTLHPAEPQQPSSGPFPGGHGQQSLRGSRVGVTHTCTVLAFDEIPGQAVPARLYFVWMKATSILEAVRRATINIVGYTTFARAGIA
ncbi:uncharacterized protein BO95DRAFT_82914 [Aspergillus brunneoviolaceus CBS 621.78]|uniref:Uncharacterized protein n=1 Tax=Aspergillus brunneoviolaceus CBS 621.78 TaxID=1450534 RepID=A0ACD1GEC8_9EURO|nr:hypothetical protein BO95DRAFT_82914 [Aspergillus brunneoviolaceus CBS 621.78]RAH47654.1 hypothetical protein BO95DRAFT_82914 [Aspergillus brunneoviolaceus CBS 621.78]